MFALYNGKNQGDAACEGLPVLLWPPQKAWLFGGDPTWDSRPIMNKCKDWLYNF